MTIYFAGGWTTIGGTSSATPIWAALVTDAASLQACQSGQGLGFISPSLYAAASSPASYAASFRDITAGTNDMYQNNAGLYPATTGYDMATGLGAPVMVGAGGSPGLAAFLCGSGVPSGPVVSGTSAGTVALDGSITASAYSTTGTTWTASTMPSSALWQNVTYGLVGSTPTYVAVQQSGTTSGAYSTNGTTWTASTMPSSDTWYSVTYGNGYFVAVAFGPTTAGAYSVNGITWTASTMPTSNYWNGVTYGNGKFVAIQNVGTTDGAYFAQSLALPVNFGIYNGPTTIN